MVVVAGLAAMLGIQHHPQLQLYVLLLRNLNVRIAKFFVCFLLHQTIVVL